MTDERVGEAYEFDERLTVLGPKLNPGDIAEDFTLDHFDGQVIRAVSLADSDGSVWILNVVNSLDTPICDIETRRWEQLRSTLPEDVVVLTISMDLPFARRDGDTMLLSGTRYCRRTGQRNSGAATGS